MKLVRNRDKVSRERDGSQAFSQAFLPSFFSGLKDDKTLLHQPFGHKKRTRVAYQRYASLIPFRTIFLFCSCFSSYSAYQLNISRYELCYRRKNLKTGRQFLFSSSETFRYFIPVYYIPERTDVVWTTVLIV